MPVCDVGELELPYLAVEDPDAMRRLARDQAHAGAPQR